MDRRDFIKKSIQAGILVGSTSSLGKYSNLLASQKFFPSNNYDLVAIKGGEPDAMFDKAIESLGGMKSFVVLLSCSGDRSSASLLRKHNDSFPIWHCADAIGDAGAAAPAVLLA